MMFVMAAPAPCVPSAAVHVVAVRVHPVPGTIMAMPCGIVVGIHIITAGSMIGPMRVGMAGVGDAVFPGAPMRPVVI